MLTKLLRCPSRQLCRAPGAKAGTEETETETETPQASTSWWAL
jgi:hypothetical protein